MAKGRGKEGKGKEGGMNGRGEQEFLPEDELEIIKKGPYYLEGTERMRETRLEADARKYCWDHCGSGGARRREGRGVWRWAWEATRYHGH